jgi:transposase-like protein
MIKESASLVTARGEPPGSNLPGCGCAINPTATACRYHERPYPPHRHRGAGTQAAGALIATTYLAGTNTRRVRRALRSVFGGEVGKEWRSARTTNAIERLHEEFKRRIKTQTVLPSADTAAKLFWALLASGQISMRKVDGWNTPTAKLIDQQLDLAA